MLSWRKKLLFALATTLLFFALLEAALWLAGVAPLSAAGDDPYVGFAGTLPLFVQQTDGDGRIEMVTARNKLAWFNVQRFPREKPAGTRRVFCLGGSTTYGRPYDDATSFCGWLRELLPSAAPDSKWEVINAGGISYASYRVAALMEELAQYEPDLFIVYTGHNEFLEERTYGELRDKPTALLQTAGLLSRTRTYSALHRLLTGGKTKTHSENRELLPGEVDAVLDHTVGPSSYHCDDALRRAVLTHFELNLARMVEIAGGCGAKLVFVVPAANLKNCSPFKSEDRTDLSPSELARCDALVARAAELEGQGRLEEALSACREAGKIDDRCAELHFCTGRLLFDLKRLGEATAEFEKAVDEDVCPLRAPAEFRAAVRTVAAERGVPLVDFELAVKNDCLRRFGHNAPGSEYFLDHVHPTIESHELLARTILERLRDDNVFAGIRAVDDGAVARARQQILARVDREAHAVAERNLAKVLNWAGKHEEAAHLAMKSLEVLPNDPECLVIGGAWLKSQGRAGKALDFFRRAVEQMPDYADARRLYGAALVDTQRLDEAREQFTELTRLAPRDARGWQMVGAILAEQGKYAEALPYYEQALELDDADADLHYNYGDALLRLGRRSDARTHFERAIELNPKDAQARRALEDAS